MATAPSIRELLRAVEAEARDRAVLLEDAGKLPAGFCARHYPLPPVLPKDATEPITAEMMAELEARWQDGERLAWAWRLAGDLDALRTLLEGRPLDPSRVNQEHLGDALTASLVQLRRPIDVLHGRAA